MNKCPEYNPEQVEENISKILNPENVYQKDIKKIMGEIFS